MKERLMDLKRSKHVRTNSCLEIAYQCQLKCEMRDITFMVDDALLALIAHALAASFSMQDMTLGPQRSRLKSEPPHHDKECPQFNLADYLAPHGL